MGCANIKDVSKIHPKKTNKTELFHDFGLKKQNSPELYSQNIPNGLISRHIEKKIVQRNSQGNISSIRDIESNGNNILELYAFSKDIQDKRTSINTMPAAIVERIMAQHDAAGNSSRPRLSNTASIQQFVDRNNNNNLTPNNHKDGKLHSNNVIREDYSLNAVKEEDMIQQL